jgi:glutaredoxin
VAVTAAAASQTGLYTRLTHGPVQGVGGPHANGQPRVVLYSAVWCGYCRAARDFFVHNGVEFTELDIENSSAGKEGYAQRGGGPIPMILVGNEQMRGFNPTRLQQHLSPWMKR